MRILLTHVLCLALVLVLTGCDLTINESFTESSQNDSASEGSDQNDGASEGGSEGSDQNDDANEGSIEGSDQNNGDSEGVSEGSNSGADDGGPTDPGPAPAEAWSVQSGAWSDPATWNDGRVPGEGTRTLISKGTKVTLNGSAPAESNVFIGELIIHGVFEVVDSRQQREVRLQTDWVHINGHDNGVAGIADGALFRIGQEDDRYRDDHFTLTLTGINIGDKSVEMPMPASHNHSSGVNGLMLMTVRNNDGFLMAGMGGRIEWYGQDKISFTKLAQTAEQGANTLRVHNVIERNFTDGAMDAEGNFITSAEDDGYLNWEVGDEIAIASTTYDYQDYSLATIQTLTDNGDGTTTFTLDRPLDNRHYGEVELYTTPAGETKELDLRAEVALLKRNIVVQGLESQNTDIEPGDRQLAQFMPRIEDPMTFLDPNVQDTQVANGIGGNIMIMPGAGRDIVIDGVQMHLMGQASRQARYPIHWHVAGDREGDLLRNSLVTSSNNRGLVVHGTANVRVEGVTLFDIHGHGFFLEDGIEVGNEFVANLAMTIHTVGGDPGPDMLQGFEPGQRSGIPRLADNVLVEAYRQMNRGYENDGSPRLPNNDPFIVDTHDLVEIFESRGAGSAAYWITNPDNAFIGNINAGAFGTGFWYILPRVPVGLSARIMGTTDWNDEDALDPARQYMRNFLKSEDYPDGYMPNRIKAIFEYNTSHSTPTGLTFFRGMDLENGRFDPDDGQEAEALGLAITDRHSGPGAYQPRWSPHNNLPLPGFRGWKSRGAATYLRFSGNAIFEDAQISDSMMGLFGGRTIGRNALLVGFSQGNADKSHDVSVTTFYDRGSIIEDSHIAGMAHENAHLYMMEKQLVSNSISHYVTGLTFEDDGSAGSISIGTGYSHYDYIPHSWSRSVIDLDGSLTNGHPYGGAGSVIVPDTPFKVGPENFHKPDGWGTYITDIPHAHFAISLGNRQNYFMANNHELNWSVTSPEGVSYGVWRLVNFRPPGLNGQWHASQFNLRAGEGIKSRDDAYVVEFSEDGTAKNGPLVLSAFIDDDMPNGGSDFNGSILVEIRGIGEREPALVSGEGTGIYLFNNEANFLTASDTSYYWDEDEETLLLNIFVRDKPVIELVKP